MPQQDSEQRDSTTNTFHISGEGPGAIPLINLFLSLITDESAVSGAELTVEFEDAPEITESAQALHAMQQGEGTLSSATNTADDVQAHANSSETNTGDALPQTSPATDTNSEGVTTTATPSPSHQRVSSDEHGTDEAAVSDEQTETTSPDSQSASSTGSDVERDETYISDVEFPDEVENDVDIESVFDDVFSLGTLKHRLIDALVAVDEPVTSDELYTLIDEQTDRSTTKGTVVDYTSSLRTSDLVDREKRNSEFGNPYEYYATEKGEAVIEVLQTDSAYNVDFTPFTELLTDESTGALSDNIDTSASQGKQTSSVFGDSDSTNNNGDDSTGDPGDIICSVCGDDFDSDNGFNGHLATCGADTSDKVYTSESTSSSNNDGNNDTSEEDDSVEPKQPSDLDISSGSAKFFVGSTLYHSAKPRTAVDITETLEGTEWEISKKRVNSVLLEFAEYSVVSRTRRTGQLGRPYEYTLTTIGEKIMRDAERSVNDFEDFQDDSDSELTYEEVIAGK